MNKFVKSSLIVFCTVFSMSYGSQLPKQQCVDALLTIKDFEQQNSGNVHWYVDSYNKFAIPYNEHDNLFVCLNAVRIQEYDGLSITNWLERVPCVSPLRKGLVKAAPLSDRIFPRYVPARWLVDTSGAVKQDVSLEFANGMTKVNFTVFMPINIVRDLEDADRSVFVFMQWRREREEQEKELRLQEQLPQSVYIENLLKSIRSKQEPFLKGLSFPVFYKK